MEGVFMNKNFLIDLYRHMEWSDAAVWTAVLASDSGQKDEKLRQYLYHLHLVQRAFLRAWRGEPRETPFPTFDDARSLMLWSRSYYPEVFAHLETVSDETLPEPMPVPWADMVEKRLGRPPDVTTVGETVLQVYLHSMYHRGQANARFRQAGGEPPPVDYIVWIWMSRPSPAWPSEQ